MSRPITSLPKGAKVKDISTLYYGKPIIFEVLDFNHPGYPSNSVTLLSERLIAVKSFDAREPSNPNSDRAASGNNRYRDSNIRQWLNKDTSPWYQAQHQYDAPPNENNVWSGHSPYENEPGFLDNFSPEFKERLLTTTLTVARNTVTDGGGSETVQDKVFLLSNTEVGLTDENGIVEGARFDKFTNDGSRQAIPTTEAVNNTSYTSTSFSSSQPWHWWLRTPFAGGARSARRVGSSGSLGNNYAWSGHHGVRPALNLQSDILVSDEVDSDGAYVIMWNEPPEITTDEEEELGDKNAPFSIVYQVTDAEGRAVGVVEKLNGITVRTIEDVEKGIDLEFAIDLATWNDLEVDSTHTMTIEATDEEGASTIKTFTFKKVASPITISGSDRDLGKRWRVFELEYSVNDDSDTTTINIAETIDGELLRELEGVIKGEVIIFSIDEETWDELEQGQHAIQFEVTNSEGAVAYRTITFTKSGDQLQFKLRNPIPTSVHAESIIFTGDLRYPSDALLLVEACNNAYDEEPAWEDITDAVLGGQKHNFTNEEKEAEKWGVDVKVSITKGEIDQVIEVHGFGFSFE